MTVLESNVADHIVKSVEKELGHIHFFNHIAVIEFNEGVHIDINSSSEFFDELKTTFGDSRPFGVVTNRVHSYSVKLMDIDLFRKKVKNLSGYAVVGHNPASLMNAEIENNFCERTKVNFDNLYEAMDVVYNEVKKNIILTLN